MSKPKTAKNIFENEDGKLGKLSETDQGDSAFDAEVFTPEVRRELVNFVKLMGRIQAQRKNPTAQSLDKDSEQR